MLHVTIHCDHCAICTEKIFKVHLGEWAIMCIWQYFGNPFTVLPRLAPSQEWQEWGERHHILHNWQRNHSSCPGDIGVDGVEGNAWRCADFSQFISRFYTRWYRFACHWFKYPYLTKQFTESWTHHRDLTKRVTLDSIMEWRKTCVQNHDSILRRGHICSSCCLFLLLLLPSLMLLLTQEGQVEGKTCAPVVFCWCLWHCCLRKGGLGWSQNLTFKEATCVHPPSGPTVKVAHALQDSLEKLNYISLKLI